MGNKTNIVLFVYNAINILVLGLLHRLFKIVEAEGFNKYYSIFLIIMIVIYGLVSFEKRISSIFKHLTITATILASTSTVIFYVLSKKNDYFSFEKESYTWLGFAGFAATVMYCMIGILSGIVLWKLKSWIVKIIIRSSE